MKHFHHYDTIIIKWNVLFADNKTNHTNKQQLKMGIRVNENGDKVPKVKVLKWCVLVATVHLINPCSYIFIYSICSILLPLLYPRCNSWFKQFLSQIQFIFAQSKVWYNNCYQMFSLNLLEQISFFSFLLYLFIYYFLFIIIKNWFTL